MAALAVSVDGMAGLVGTSAGVAYAGSTCSTETTDAICPQALFDALNAAISSYPRGVFQGTSEAMAGVAETFGRGIDHSCTIPAPRM